MSTQNICFYSEIRKILCGYPILSVAMTVQIVCDKIRATYLRICALSENSDQPVLSHSRIRIFTGHILNSQGCKVTSCRHGRL